MGPGGATDQEVRPPTRLHPRTNPPPRHGAGESAGLANGFHVQKPASGQLLLHDPAAMPAAITVCSAGLPPPLTAPSLAPVVAGTALAEANDVRTEGRRRVPALALAMTLAWLGSGQRLDSPTQRRLMADESITQATRTLIRLSEFPRFQIEGWVLPQPPDNAAYFSSAQREALLDELDFTSVTGFEVATAENARLMLMLLATRALEGDEGVTLSPGMTTAFALRRDYDTHRSFSLETVAIADVMLNLTWLPLRQSPLEAKSLHDLMSDAAAGTGGAAIALAHADPGPFLLLYTAAAIIILRFACGVGDAAFRFGKSLWLDPRE